MSKRYYWVVVTDWATIETSKERAYEIYEVYDHARIERWDVLNGTARTIKEK